MLRQENAPEETARFSSAPPRPPQPPTPAEAARVPTEELIAAVAEIEARRDASQRWQADTIALGDAVHQLGLNMSPEELLAAIEDVRARKFADAQHQAMVQSRRRSKRTMLAVTVVLLLIPVLLMGLLVTRSVQQPEMATPAAIVSTAPVTEAGTYTLDSLPPQQTAYTDLQTIYELNHGKPWSQAALQSQQYVREKTLNLGTFRSGWGIRMLNGTPHLQGWGTRDANGLVRSLSSAPLLGGQPNTTFTIPIANLGSIKDPTRIVIQGDEGLATSRTIEVLEFTPGQARALLADH